MADLADGVPGKAAGTVLGVRAVRDGPAGKRRCPARLRRPVS
jgi:hypothetical protein